MITDPSLLVGQSVRIYWNLHKHVWSVQDERTHRVIAHVGEVSLTGVRFVVSEAGRQLVIRRQRKRVHAYACGQVGPAGDGAGVPTSYNPYKGPRFVAEGSEVTQAAGARFGSADGRPVLVSFGAE